MPRTKFDNYLGDGVYVDFDGEHIVLKANHHENPTDTIYLNFSVMKSLKGYEERLMRMLNQDDPPFPIVESEGE